jgi:hypothetical protein
MFAIVSALLSYLSALFRPKRQLALEVLALRQGVHGELSFRLQLAAQTTRGNDFANGNSQGWPPGVLGRRPRSALFDRDVLAAFLERLITVPPFDARFYCRRTVGKSRMESLIGTTGNPNVARNRRGASGKLSFGVLVGASPAPLVCKR